MADQIYFGEGAVLSCCPLTDLQGILWQGYEFFSSTTSPIMLSQTQSDNLISQGTSVNGFTFILPIDPLDGQISSLTFNNAVQNITINGNGKTVIGGTISGPTSIGTRYTFKYYSEISAWLRIL